MLNSSRYPYSVILDVKEGLQDMGEGAKQSLKDTSSALSEKRQGKVYISSCYPSSLLILKLFLLFFTGAEQSLKEAESEAPKKGKGLMDTLRDWVAPAAEKTRGKFLFFLNLDTVTLKLDLICFC